MNRFSFFLRHSVSDFTKKVIALCGKAGFKPRVVQETNGVIAIVGLVASGIGISILPARRTDSLFV